MATNDHIGLLLTNLGTPDSTDIKDVQKYLDEFLMDKRVIDFPYLFRYFLMHCLVVPKRAPKSAAAYRKVWMPEGSPLLVYAEKLQKMIQGKVSFPVGLSMRYGNPTTEQAFETMLARDSDLKEVIVLPLYPQYTMSSYDTAVEKVKQVYRKGNYPFKIRILNPFYKHPDYIAALSAQIKPFLDEEYDKLLFSYHGLPERHMMKDDKRIAKGGADFQLPEVNYQKQAHETSRLVAEYLQIPRAKYEVSFQSRLVSAGAEWIKPYTVNRLEEMAAEGVKKLIVVCPAFINDCLETLEEIGIEGKNLFESFGGERLRLVPCINAQEQFADVIIKWTEKGQ